MSRGKIAWFGTPALAALVLSGPAGPGPDARAASPQEPGPRAPSGQPGASRTPLPPKPPPPPDPPADEAGLLPYLATTAEAIRYYRARVERIPHDYIDYCYLGEMYRREARATGSLDDYREAEAALRKALEVFPNYPRAQSSLASVLCSRHKFAEGLEFARKVQAVDPRNVDALATVADALMELGRYAEAEVALGELHGLSPIPEVLARRANLAELKGDPDEAIRLIRRAAEAVRRVTSDPKAVAWYLGIQGDFAFNAGRIDEARRQYLQVPEGVDAFHDATYGLARVAFAEGDLGLAVDRLKKAVAIGPDAHMLAALGDLLVELGRPDEAKPYHDRVFQVTGDDSERRRALAKFLADHDRDLPRALDLARKDYAERQDVFGADNLAWCLFKNGQVEEAARSMDAALRLGTKDPNFLFHAGMIHLKRGDKEKARTFLGKALTINPKFAILQGDEARRALESLDEPARKP